MYLKQIEQLVVLQRVDNEIFALRQELEAAPLEVEGLQANVQDLTSRKEQLQEKLDYLGAQEKRMSQEIEEDNLKIKKSKNKLMMVGNNREYHAMMREMDNLEKLNRLREEERLTLMEELGAQQTSMEELNQEYETAMQELGAKEANLQARTGEAEKRLAELDKIRKNAGKLVPPPILGRYEFIRSRLPHPVIVPVEAGVCGGCHISIPPQSFIELQKGEQILSCPNCQRLIYWCEHFCQEEEEEKQEASA